MKNLIAENLFRQKINLIFSKGLSKTAIAEAVVSRNDIEGKKSFDKKGNFLFSVEKEINNLFADNMWISLLDKTCKIWYNVYS